MNCSDLIERSLREYNSNRVNGQVLLETSLLAAAKKYRISTSAVPDAGQGMRVSALFRGAKNACLILNSAKHLTLDNRWIRGSSAAPQNDIGNGILTEFSIAQKLALAASL